MDLKSRWNPRERCDSYDRGELIKAVREYIQECIYFYEKEIETMRRIISTNL